MSREVRVRVYAGGREIHCTHTIHRDRTVDDQWWCGTGGRWRRTYRHFFWLIVHFAVVVIVVSCNLFEMSSTSSVQAAARRRFDSKSFYVNTLYIRHVYVILERMSAWRPTFGLDRVLDPWTTRTKIQKKKKNTRDGCSSSVPIIGADAKHDDNNIHSALSVRTLHDCVETSGDSHHR